MSLSVCAALWYPVEDDCRRYRAITLWIVLIGCLLPFALLVCPSRIFRAHVVCIVAKAFISMGLLIAEPSEYEALPKAEFTDSKSRRLRKRSSIGGTLSSLPVVGAILQGAQAVSGSSAQQSSSKKRLTLAGRLRV